MKKNRILLTGILMTLMVGIFTSFAMPAQAVNRHKQVQKTVENIYSATKRNDLKAVKKNVAIQKSSIVNAFWPEMKKYHKDLSYEVKSVDVTGKKAVVRVKVKYQNLSRVHYRALDRYNKWYLAQSKKPSIKAVQANYRANFKKEVKGYQKKYSTKTVKLTLNRKGEVWKANTLNKGGIDSITGGYQTAFDAYYKE